MAGGAAGLCRTRPVAALRLYGWFRNAFLGCLPGTYVLALIFRPLG